MTHEPLTRDDLRSTLAAARVVPVLRADSADRLVALAEASLDLGCTVIELTATTPGWREALERLATDPRFDSVVLAMGTVTDASTAADAGALGAQFLVSPYPASAAVLPTGPLLVQGGLTPSELNSVLASSGVAKLFPAASVGIGHLRAVRDILPGAEIMPTGGITLDTAGDWLDAGAIAVGVGTALFRAEPAQTREALERLRARG